MEETIPNLNPEVPHLNNEASLRKKVLPVLLVVLILAGGTLTGWWFSGRTTSSAPAEGGTGIVDKASIKKGVEFGVKDTTNFPDQAMGVLEAGGIENEGTHKLVREGGPSQNVYLTSSVVDLDQFVGEKIQVWGATMTAKKAGWLMDVGKIKVLE